MKTAALLRKLGIQEKNLGACIGPDCWLKTSGTELVSYNPSTGEPIASVLRATLKEYEMVAYLAQQSFRTWRMRPAPKRGELVRDLGYALRELKEPLGDLVTLEMGKIRTEGHGEVEEMINMCDEAAGYSRQLCGVTTHSERSQHRMYEQWHPLGPVGVITAFNFPVAVWSWNAAVAAVCGDTVVWKPSSYTPLCAIAVQHIANRVMAAHGVSGVFTLAIGSSEVGNAMVEDTRLPLISFTGSTEVGRGVAEKVARRFGQRILELGGNNAIIVAADADIEMAARSIVFGNVGTTGQRCTSTRRIFAHASVVDTLCEKLVRYYAKIHIGDPLEEGVLMGPLVAESAVDDMMKALQEAEAQGGKVLCGGRRLAKLGKNFVEPTIVRMRHQSGIVYKETFAPILYVMSYYDSLDNALFEHNRVPQGLSSAIFTDSIRAAEYFLSVEGSDCGIANVNVGTSGAEIGLAFGGEKETGGGREAGSDAWKQYMRRQTCTINWGKELPLAQGVKFDVE